MIRVFAVLALAATLSAPAVLAQATAAPAAQVHCPAQPGPAASPALTAFTSGDFATAESLYAAQTSAAAATAYPGLVRAQLEANDFPAALTSAKAAIAAQPKSAVALSLLGDVLYRSGQVPESFSPAVMKSSLTGLNDGTISLQGVSGPIVKVVPKEGGVEVDRPNVYTTTGEFLPVKTPVKLPVLRFTTNETPQEYTASFDITPLSHKMGIEASGLMGFYLLRTFITDINYRDALARIQFDQNRRYLERAATGHY